VAWDYDRLRGHNSHENPKDVRPSASYSQRQKSGMQIFHIKSQANDLLLWEILFLVVIFHSN
jgi:hypothetical protein